MIKMNKILGGHKYVANFLDAPIRIGMVFRMDEEQFIPAMHFNDAFPGIDLAKWIEAGTKGMLKFAEAKDVTISFGASAASGIGKSAVKFKFQRSRSVSNTKRTLEIIRPVVHKPLFKAFTFKKDWQPDILG